MRLIAMASFSFELYVKTPLNMNGPKEGRGTVRKLSPVDTNEAGVSEAETKLIEITCIHEL
jgi:hypothetical protein